MGLLSMFFGSNQNNYSVTKDELIDVYIEKLHVLNTTSGELTILHLPTLFKKRHRLTRKDDYGAFNTEK